MGEALAVHIPLVNPNELEAVIAALHVVEGESVTAGATLAVVETTKSTLEVTAERAGYVVGLRGAQGDTMRAGDVLLWLADEPDWAPPKMESVEHTETPSGGPRLTRPARARAEAAGIDLTTLPQGTLITLDWLEAWMTETNDLPPIDPNKIIVYGGGGHGKAVIELLTAIGGFEVVSVLDDGLPAGTEVMGVSIGGGHEQLQPLRAEAVGRAVNAVGGIGDIGSRMRVFELLQAAGFSMPAVVHPEAFVEVSAVLADAVQVFPHAYVGSDAEIGFGVIVNTGAVISHDCTLEPYANIAPGAKLAGGVHVGQSVLIGMGVTINLNVTIGTEARIGNSAVIKRDVPANEIVPAGAVWPLVER